MTTKDQLKSIYVKLNEWNDFLGGDKQSTYLVIKKILIEKIQSLISSKINSFKKDLLLINFLKRNNKPAKQVNLEL